MKWTDDEIKSSILNLMHSLGIERMPTHMEMRNNSLSGLSRAINQSGNTNYWSKIIEVPMKKREKKWSNELIEKELKKSMNVLCIDRMPTAAELQTIGRNDLHCAISKQATYRYWSKKIGVDLKSNETTKGQTYEKKAEKILVGMGNDVKNMTTKHPFDLLVNNNVKVDVKMGVAHYHFGSRAHTFKPSSKYSTCDIYICLALNEEGLNEKTFVIPSKFARVETINVGIDSKYNKFVNRWDFIDDYSNFYNSVVV